MSKSGSLYVLKFGDIIKIGITNRDVALRTKGISKSFGSDFSVETQIKFSDGSIPLKVETVLLRELRETCTQPAGVFDGSTECFLDVDYGVLLKRIVEEVSTNYMK